MVLVKKSNGKRCMCVDFIDLNKTCLKDSFSLPWIHLIVDAIAENKILSFINTYLGYN